MRASKLLSSATVAIVLLSATGVAAKEELKSGNPWRGTEIGYEHGFSAHSLSKSADQSYNPYYVHTLTLQPQWHVGEYLAFRAKLAIEQELSDADDTTYKNEVMLSDLNLEAVTPGVTEPFTGVRLGGGLRFVFPTSKVAQATTMRLAISPAISLSRKFPLLEGLVLGYGARFNFAFHQYTTAQQDAPGIASCSVDDIRCGTNLGRRNAWGQLMHGPNLSLSPLSGLGVDLSFFFVNSFLYGLSDGGQYLNDEKDVNVRRAQFFTGSVSYEALDFLTVALSFATMYGELALDGTYQTPFFNRYTQLSVGFSISIDPLIGKFQ